MNKRMPRHACTLAYAHDVYTHVYAHIYTHAHAHVYTRVYYRDALHRLPNNCRAVVGVGVVDPFVRRHAF